jgi:hypothetical protein
MTREERIKLAIEKGYKYNPETGNINGVRGNIITCKTPNRYLTIQITFNNKIYQIFAHQFAWYWINKECVVQIDHINGIKTDNRICNLRSISNQENSFNRKKAKGYYWNKRDNKWMAQIKINAKNINLGLYNNEEDARQAYLQGKEKYHKING